MNNQNNIKIVESSKKKNDEIIEVEDGKIFSQDRNNYIKKNWSPTVNEAGLI